MRRSAVSKNKNEKSKTPEVANRLVFSTDPRDQEKIKCSRCGKLRDECRCQHQESADQSFVAIFRLEKAGRGGKTVTLIEGLPKNEKFLADFAKNLKSATGSGGSSYISEKSGVVEIQGDKRDQIKKIFTQKGIRFRGM